MKKPGKTKPPNQPLPMAYSPFPFAARGTSSGGDGGGATGGSGAPVVLITDTSTAFFQSSGCTWPTYGTATTPPCSYFSATQTTWFFWEAWQGTTRWIMCKTYNHSTDTWNGPFFVSSNTLTDDDHGVPSCERDFEGYVYVFFGAHGANGFKVARTTNPDDPTSWTALSDLGTALSYPKPTTVGSALFVGGRSFVDGITNPYVFYQTTALSGGAPTWSAEKVVIDWDNPGGIGSRVYVGNHVLVGSIIHFCATYADANDTFRQDIYYFKYNTADGSISNFDDSVTVSAASQPISLTTSNTSFLIVDQRSGNTFGNVPQLCFDTNGHPHVGYMDGPSGGPYSFKHIWHNGTVWQAADTVGAFDNGNALHRFDTSAMIPLPGGLVDAYWISASPFGFARGGNVSKRRWDGAAFGPTQLILAARSAFALDCLGMVRNAPTNASFKARVMFAEISGDATAESGALRLFAYGDSGELRRPFQTETQNIVAAFSSAPTDNRKEMIDEFLSYMKGNNLWTKFDLYYNMAAADSQAMRINWVTPGSFTLTDVGGGPTFSANSHVVGNGTSQKLSTGFTASVNATKATQNSCGLYVHVLNNVANDGYFDVGGGSTAFVQINTRLLTGDFMRGAMNNATNDSYNAQTNSTGRSSLERSVSNLTTAVKDGSAAGTSATASTALANGVMHICGTTTGFSGRQIRRMAFGSHFTAAQRQTQRVGEIRCDFALTL